MSARTLSGDVWRVVLSMAAGVLIASVSAATTLAQQPVASETVGAAHAAASGEKKGGSAQSPQVKTGPAKGGPIVRGSATVVDHNAIGVSVVRPDGGQRPVGLSPGRSAVLAAPMPPAPSGAAAGVGSRALPALRIPGPAPRPLVLSHGTINGAAFARPGTALVPLGGPAKHASAGINGTSIQPKH